MSESSIIEILRWLLADIKMKVLMLILSFLFIFIHTFLTYKALQLQFDLFYGILILNQKQAIYLKSVIKMKKE